TDRARDDSVSQLLRAGADVWRVTSGLSDSALADQIQQDRIDVLVDLMVHAPFNRIMVFARRPAPVQITYLGYPSTTGMAAIDYRFTDAFLDPPVESDRYYTE